MSEQASLRQRKASNNVKDQHNESNLPCTSTRPRPSPIPRPTSYASVLSTAHSETDHSEILSPTPRKHHLLQQQASQWLSSSLSPSPSRPNSPLNPNSPRTNRSHKTSLSFSSLAEQDKGRPGIGRVEGINSSFARRWVRWMSRHGMDNWVLPIEILAMLWIKWAVGLGSYSGENAPPMYGDYEAQRHWMEITYHLPVRQWYKYDLQYWGLDYPPLTAYVSWMCGYIAHKIDPSWVELDTSRGMETPTSKVFMRTTVLLLDLAIYVPSLVFFAFRSPLLRHRSQRAKSVALLTLLLQPSLIFIDNGHFQYNSVMLGLALQALNFFGEGKDLLGAVCFVLSLGFKQMALYYAPVVFAYLFGKCLLLGWVSGTRHLFAIGMTTIFSFVILFSPFLSAFPTHIIPPITRIFPFARGLFEDKVANFWCASNVFIKWHRYISARHLPKLATALTAVGFLPSMISLLAPGVKAFGALEGKHAVEISKDSMSPSTQAASKPSPTFTLFAHALLQCSLAFFLFSFQVHEKTILVPLLPMSLLMVASAPNVDGDWEWGVLVNNVAAFSMWPLLKRDGLAVQYLALLLQWNYSIGHQPFRQVHLKHFTLLTYATIFILHTLELLYTPPARYPDLFPVLNALVCAGVFGLAWLWSIKRLVELTWVMGDLRKTSSAAIPSPMLRVTKLSTVNTGHFPPVQEELMESNLNGLADRRTRTVSLQGGTGAGLRKRQRMSTSGIQWPRSAVEGRGSIDLSEKQ